jgi:hypothetical protein
LIQHITVTGQISDIENVENLPNQVELQVLFEFDRLCQPYVLCDEAIAIGKSLR